MNSRTFRSCSSAALSVASSIVSAAAIRSKCDPMARNGWTISACDGVEVPALIQEQRDMRQGFEPRPELAVGAADPLRHGPDLARALGEDGDDLVGLAQLHGPQDDALFLVEGHV